MESPRKVILAPCLPPPPFLFLLRFLGLLVQSTSPGEQHGLDLACARFIYSANVPFITVDNPWFRAFVQGLRPNAKVPARQRIAGCLLDEVYHAERKELSEEHRDVYVTLAADCWSNILATPVVGFSIDDNICEVVETTGIPHTAENLSRSCCTAISNVEKELKCKVVGLVTDSASNMVAMRGIVVQSHPGIFPP